MKILSLSSFVQKEIRFKNSEKSTNQNINCSLCLEYFNCRNSYISISQRWDVCQSEKEKKTPVVNNSDAETNYKFLIKKCCW